MGIVRGGGGGGGAPAGTNVPVADHAGVTVDTTTYDNPFTGVGKLTTLVFPGYTAGIAFAAAGDAFPRLMIGSENDMYAGDGTFDSYNTPGGGLIFKFGAGVNTRVGFNSTYWGASQDGVEFFLVAPAPADANVSTSERVQWYDDTTGAPKIRFKQKDAAGTLFSGIAESASPITSGALPTATLASGTGAQLLASRAVEAHTPVTFNPGVATTATCTVALSPDNVTYSTLAVITKPVGTVFDGEIEDVVVRVPAGWYLKLTVNAQATLGTTTYY